MRGIIKKWIFPGGGEAAVLYCTRCRRLALSLFLTILFLLPSGASRTVSALEFPPPEKISFPPLRFSPPSAQRIILENGLRLYIMEDHELPVVKVTLLIAAGAMYDEAGEEGCAELTAALMRSGGTELMTPRQLDEILAGMAATIEPAAGMEQVQWSLFSLRNNFENVFEIFSRIIRAPRFDAGRLKLLKELKSEEIRRLPDDPQRWAFKEFSRLMYAGNPRGRLPTRSSINRITATELRRCHRRYYAPDNMILAVSGDIRPADAERIVRRAFGDWQDKSDKPSVPAPFQNFHGGQYYLLKDTPQTVIVIGRPAPAKGTEDYFAFEIIDHVLGSGGFGSRIFQKIRTDRGLAYATGSFYRDRKDYGVLGAYALTGTDTAVAVVQLITDIVHEMGRNGLSREEIAKAKNAILNSFIFSFATPHQLASQQAALAFDALPDDFLSRYRPRIEAITAAEIKAAAAAWLKSDQALLFMLGNRYGYEKTSSFYKDLQKVMVNYD